MSWRSLYLRLLLRGVINPALALALLRLSWRARSRSWARRFPFLPIPSAEYMRWRMHTAYGAHESVPPIEDVIRFAQWASPRP